MVGVAEKLAVAARLAAQDNVATLLHAARAGGAVAVRAMTGDGQEAPRIVALCDIPAGHKIALQDIAEGGAVLKYGLPIARAITAIGKGAHVHVHNAVSTVSATANERPQAAQEGAIIAPDTLRELVRERAAAAGLAGPAAGHLADHMVEAHLRGVETHGVWRLSGYLSRIAAGGVDAAAEPAIEAQGAVLRVDGRNGLGHHVAAVAADALAPAAKAHGAAVALIRSSQHFGFAGYYATRLAHHGLLALVTSNGQVLVGPPGARRALFSNDPVALAAPLPDGSYFEFDMATSGTSRANIVRAAQEGRPIAPGLALDADGNPTTDAAAAAHGVLLPFGGARGFGLIAAIEVLTGVLPGGAYADLVGSKEADLARPEGTSHFMLAIDLEAALGRAAFESRLADLVRRIAAIPMRPGAAMPRHPGARRWALRRERLARGIPLSAADAEALRALAGDLGRPLEL